MKAIITIFGLLLFIQLADPATVRIETYTCGIACKKGLKKCGKECYDPKYLTCFDDVLCQNGFKKCGFECYDPNLYTCSGGLICANGLKQCGKYCYDPKFYDCFEDITCNVTTTYTLFNEQIFAE